MMGVGRIRNGDTYLYKYPAACVVDSRNQDMYLMKMDAEVLLINQRGCCPFQIIHHLCSRKWTLEVGVLNIIDVPTHFRVRDESYEKPSFRTGCKLKEDM